LRLPKTEVFPENAATAVKEEEEEAELFPRDIRADNGVSVVVPLPWKDEVFLGVVGAFIPSLESTASLVRRSATASPSEKFFLT